MNNNTKLVHDYIHTAMTAPLDGLADAIRPFFADDFKCYAFAPVDDCHSIQDIAVKFWTPIRKAFAPINRTTTIDINGTCAFDENEWVCGMGMYEGRFSENLYTIPATNALNYVRFADFYQVINGKITMAYKLMDYVGLMIRTGVSPLPKSLGSDVDTVFPRTQDGCIYTTADPKSTQQSHNIMTGMLADLLQTKKTKNGTQDSIWADDMVWYGPSGIGTFYGMDGFSVYRNAFLNTFPDRDYGVHYGVISKNNYACLTSWKAVIATHKGSGWLGLAPTGKIVSMRLADFYCIKDGKITENWVLLDVIDVFRQLGVDIFDIVEKIQTKGLFDIPSEPRHPHANTPEDIAFKKKIFKVDL